MKKSKIRGSLLANADQFKRSERSLQQMIQDGMLFRLRRKTISKDTKVTDMLYACYESAANGEDFSEQLDNIHARYQEIDDGLNLDFLS